MSSAPGLHLTVKCANRLLGLVAVSNGQRMGHDVSNVLAQMQGRRLRGAGQLGMFFPEQAPEVCDGI